MKAGGEDKRKKKEERNFVKHFFLYMDLSVFILLKPSNVYK